MSIDYSHVENLPSILYGFYADILISNLPNDQYYFLDISKPERIDSFNTAEFLSKNKNLLLDCVQEGFSSIVPLIYKKLIIEGNIPENKIFLLSGAVDIQDIVNAEAKKLGKRPFFSRWVNWFEYLMSLDIHSNINHLEELHSITNAKFEKSFICLNRRWRLHRPTLVGMLAKRNLLDKGYISLTEVDTPISWDDFIISILQTHKNDKEIFDFFSNQKDFIKNLTPLTLDNSTLKQQVSCFRINSNLDYYYKNSYFSVVTETNFYNNDEDYHCFYNTCEATRFLTEKIYKPVIYKHPFILMATHKTLSVFKELGYKTFHPYIDESYDNEIDDGARFLKILNEIERLSNLSSYELEKFISNTKPICDFNYNKLKQIFSSFIS